MVDPTQGESGDAATLMFKSEMQRIGTQLLSVGLLGH
jgi:hypothetical protein